MKKPEEASGDNTTHNALKQAALSKLKSFFRAPYVERLERSRKALTNILIIMLFLLLIIFTIKQANKDTLTINAFDVPESLAKTGLTGRVITNKITDNLNFLKTKTSKDMPLVERDRVQAYSEVEVPGTGISLNTVVSFMKEFFPIATKRITGEIVLLPKDSLQMTIRRNAKKEATFTVARDKLGTLYLQAAKYILANSEQQYILASYLYEHQQDSASVQVVFELLQQCFDNPNKDDDHWAYWLKARIYKDAKEYDRALEELSNAINEKDDFALAYYTRAQIFLELGDFLQSEEMLAQATAINPNIKEDFAHELQLKRAPAAFAQKEDLDNKIKSIDEELAVIKQAQQILNDVGADSLQKTVIKLTEEIARAPLTGEGVEVAIQQQQSRADAVKKVDYYNALLDEKDVRQDFLNEKQQTQEQLQRIDIILNEPAPKGTKKGWIYLGEYSSKKNKWLTRYLVFKDNTLPQSLKNSEKKVRKKTGSLNIREGKPTENAEYRAVIEALKPGKKVRIEKVEAWGSSDFIWAQVSY